MKLKEHFELLAAYNQTMNKKMYQVASCLNQNELFDDRGAFFGSVFNTLSHIFTCDVLWLKRFSEHFSCQEVLSELTSFPMPKRLDQHFFDEFSLLAEQRVWLDTLIIHWVATLSDSDLATTLSYHTVKGTIANKQFSSLILHFFNHQTHHRGQASTLLSQMGKDLGVTDLLVYIPE